MRRLLQRTEENRELNAWRVRVQTEQNAYQAISGEPGIKQLVTMPDGTNGFFAQAEIASMTREGRRRRLLCPTGMPCRVVERDRWVWRRRPPLWEGASRAGGGGTSANSGRRSARSRYP